VLDFNRYTGLASFPVDPRIEALADIELVSGSIMELMDDEGIDISQLIIRCDLEEELVNDSVNRLIDRGLIKRNGRRYFLV